MQVLHQLPRFEHPNLLVGGETMDDAGVYALDAERALVLTVDVLTPVSDDPYVFGQIAAANSLSDVYAMGGRPLAALSILTFPAGEIEHEMVRSILAGVWDKVREAGVVIAGGHTLKDAEVKCGLAVTGLVHPDRVVRNTGARPGDVLVLTKPLGVGIITTALRVDLATAQSVAQANHVMCELNRPAAEVTCEVGVNAATDVTGFGLLGHAWEMAQASSEGGTNQISDIRLQKSEAGADLFTKIPGRKGIPDWRFPIGDRQSARSQESELRRAETGVDVVIEAGRVPIIPGALDLARQSLFPAGSLKNYDFMKTRAHFAPSVPEELCLLLCDAQTSGGLLISLPEARAEELVTRLHAAGVSAATVVGHVRPGEGRLSVT